MNLQNISKGLNFPIGLTIIVSFILIILGNTLELVKIANKSMTLNNIPNDIQNTVYVIFSTSLLCLIFNLVFSRFFKNKVLLSVFFLILLFSLFIASIFLFVNTLKLQVAHYVGIPGITLDTNNINTIKGLLYFLALLGLIASVTNKGFTIYKLMK